MRPNTRWHRLIVPLALLLLVGCQTGPSSSLTRGGGTGANATTGDPLLGGQPPLPSTGASARGTDRSAPSTLTGTGNSSRSGGPSGSPLNTLPTPSGSTSPAALASGTASTLDPAATLRIPGNPPDPRGDIGWRTPGDTPRATIQPPAPVGAGGIDTTPAVPLPPLTQVAHRPEGATLEQLLNQVKSRGGIQPQLLDRGNEWFFSCRVMSQVPGSQGGFQNNPNLLHCYEATADTSVAAVSAVLEQMDQERR
jgi:hypothetical protein